MNIKIIAPSWNDKFELSGGFYFVSDIQAYIEYITKKHETLTAILLFMFTSKELIIDQCSK